MEYQLMKQVNYSIVECLLAYKAHEIVQASSQSHDGLVDCTIIATGTSDTHIFTLHDKVKFMLKEKYQITILSDIKYSSNWIVLDIEGIVLHLFKAEVREYYAIEELLKEKGYQLEVVDDEIFTINVNKA